MNNSRKRSRDSNSLKRIKITNNGNKSNNHRSSSLSSINSDHTLNENQITINEFSIKEIKQMCECITKTDCIFPHYIHDTNCHSLYNVLKSQHNLLFQNAKCCSINHKCSIINDGLNFYVCLFCVFYGCDQHLTEHARTKKHYLWFELSSQSIYCCKCGEYHFSQWTDQLITHFIMKAKKRKEKESMKFNSKNADMIISLPNHKHIWKQFECIHDNGYLGIRGILNLGNTCFMSVVIGTFIHNRYLRNYFLSNSHFDNCKHMQTPQIAKPNCNADCFACQMQELYNDFYCGINKYSVSIHKLLASIWKEDRYEMNNHEMHDCHEFFMAFISLIHKKCQCNNKAIIKANDEKNCKCIAHQTFRGLWKSQITCNNKGCGHVSCKTEPFVDINLHIRHSNKNGEYYYSKTIIEALESYMCEEYMEDYKCNKCKQKQCNKSFKIDSLPHCLCLHLKRFEGDDCKNNNNNTNVTKSLSNSPSAPFVNNNNNNNNRTHRRKHSLDSHLNVKSHGNGLEKIDEFVSFPVDELLDLSQFVSDLNDRNCVYKLRSMIIHSGVLSSGHYICCIRKKNRWFWCDDTNVYPIEVAIVKQQKAYMLLYERQ